MDAEAIHRRLDEQEAELRRLRVALSQSRSAPAWPTPFASEGRADSPDLGTSSQAGIEQAELTSLGSNSEQPGAEKKKDDGWIDLSDEKWTVKLGGHVQLDYVTWADADPAIPGTQNYFEFRRLRLVADGAGYGVYDFRLQMTLEPETVGETPGVISPDVKDAYFSMNETPWLGRLRIGNFFVPFSLEQVTNDTNNI
ncbi:MAG: porin, partial [Pirellulales bacterium]